MNHIMEIQPMPPDDLPETLDPLSMQSRKRQRLSENQDVSNTKSLPAPLRASGRIRIKMTAAAELKLPQPATKPTTKVLNSSISNIKQRRKTKKLKSDLVSELAIDVKRPSSVLVDTSIRALLTNVAFAQLSPENQKILVESLPLVDRPTVLSTEHQSVELNLSSINNEFFNRACIEWRDRLSNGEFTNEHQTKLRAEHEREKSKIDPWKARNFEGIWGIKSNGHSVGAMMEKSAMEMKQRVEQGDFEIPEGFINEVWERKESEELDEDSKLESNDNWQMTPSPSNSPSQNPSVSTSVPTPPEIVSSTQHEASESPAQSSTAIQMTVSKISKTMSDQPVIAEATSSVDYTHLAEKESQEPSPLEYVVDDDYSSNIESQEGVQRWYHEHEHDYLKNENEPEPSGMENIDEHFENDIVESEVEECPIGSNLDHREEDLEADSRSIAFGNVSRMTMHDGAGGSRINTYDAELPQDIFQKQDDVGASYQEVPSGVLTNNFIHPQERTPVFVRQVFEPSCTNRFKGAVIIQDDQTEPVSYNHDPYVMEEAEIDTGTCFKDGLHMNLSKNVKLLAIPPAVKYNEKYIIEETRQHHLQHHQQIHQQPSSFRGNGSANSYFVGGTNFAYISKVGNKIETGEPPVIVKHESNNNQGQIKQRIIYEIAREPKITYEHQPATHHVTYAAQPTQEVFQMVKHPNGTTTIYETTGQPQKKTIIQRKKTSDPYTVQVVANANNNTIILTPIGSTSQQTIQQPQKSIVHIHRTMQSSAPPVQFLAAPHSFLKKQTIIHPQMTQKPQTNYTTVIRTPSMIAPTQPQVITTVSSKVQKPIQKQKVIMSTSSLQQYRSYNQKAGHGSRKQLHPQHIIRPSPSATTTQVIHQQIKQETNQIPVILPAASSEQVIMSSAPLSICTNQIQNNPVVIGPPPGINNIYVRPKRPQQIFQHSPTPMNNLMASNVMSTHNIMSSHNNIISSHSNILSNHNHDINSTVMSSHSNVLTTNHVMSNHSPVMATNNVISNHSNVPPTLVNHVNSICNLGLNNQQILATSVPRMRHQQNNQRPPPGTVNLERSYQICQAVIQNSANPNRHQLNNQLKAPPQVMGQKKF